MPRSTLRYRPSSDPHHQLSLRRLTQELEDLQAREPQRGPKGATGPTGAQGPDGLPNLTAVSNNPGRSFNTPFQPHMTRPTICVYACRLHTQLSATGTSMARVQLKSDAAESPTMICSQAEHQLAITLGISIGQQSDVVNSVYHVVPAGHYVSLVPTTSNGGTATFVQQLEIVL